MIRVVSFEAYHYAEQPDGSRARVRANVTLTIRGDSAELTLQDPPRVVYLAARPAMLLAALRNAVPDGSGMVPLNGPGKYDDECTLARERTGGSVLLMVIGGRLGHGFSAQLAPEHANDRSGVAEVLRKVAAEIEGVGA